MRKIKAHRLVERREKEERRTVRIKDGRVKREQEEKAFLSIKKSLKEGRRGSNGEGMGGGRGEERDGRVSSPLRTQVDQQYFLIL